MIEILSRYPLGVVEAVLSPFSGLPAKYEWLPSIKAVVEECEAHMAPLRRRAEREHILEQRATMLPPPEHEHPTLQQMQDRHGENWGLRPASEKPSPWKSADELQRIGGLSEADWDRIPNQGDPPAFKGKRALIDELTSGLE